MELAASLHGKQITLQKTARVFPAEGRFFRACHRSWIFIMSLIVSNDSENHSARIKKAADLDLPDVF